MDISFVAGEAVQQRDNPREVQTLARVPPCTELVSARTRLWPCLRNPHFLSLKHLGYSRFLLPSFLSQLNLPGIVSVTGSTVPGKVSLESSRDRFSGLMWAPVPEKLLAGLSVQLLCYHNCVYLSVQKSHGPICWHSVMKRKTNAKFAVYYFCLQMRLHFSSISVYCVLSKMRVLHFHS